MKHASHRIVLDEHKEFSIIGLGDIHYGSSDCSESHLIRAIHDIQNTPNCRWVGCGDYIDFARTTFRNYLRGYAADSTTIRNLDSIAYDMENALFNRHLKHIADRCLGIIEGNHTWVTDRGVSTGQRLAELLDCPYMGDLGALTLHAFIANRKLRSFRILAHHGSWGSAQTPGGDLNSLIKKGESWLVDITLSGHTHKKFAYSEPKMTWPVKGDFELVEVPHVYVRTGGYQRVYRETDECGRYGEAKMLKPSDLGHVKVTFSLTQHKRKRDEFTVRVTQ